MTDTPPVMTLFPRGFDSALFRPDGVLTKSARVQAAARKELVWPGPCGAAGLEVANTGRR